MRKINFAIILSLILFQVSVFAQTESIDSTGLPGDNFSLEGALEMFKTASSPEDFEKKINEENNYINNLDLNEDGEVDYIRVEDKMEGNIHVLVLQVPINENESQDIAVIEIEKTGEKSAVLQIVGDEDIYGPEVFAEPFDEETKTDGKGGPSADITVYRVVVNVWIWPSVRFVYGPRYRVWVSPYHWHVYPRWWSPWRPHPWRWHHQRGVRYHTNYRVVHTRRVVNAPRVYRPHRRTSVTVKRRTTTVGVKRTNNGKVVKSKTTTTTTRGAVKKNNNTAKAGKKTTTTKVGVKKGPDGTIKAGKKTTTTRAGVKKTKNGNVKAGKKTTTTRTGVRKKNGNVKAGRSKTTTTRNRQGYRKRTTTTKAGRKGNKAGVKRTRTTTTRKRKH